MLAYQGHLNLALVIIVGTLAELAGSYASYAVGRIGGRPLVHKLGRYVLVTESDVSRAERFLEGRGTWAIPVGRMLPFVRAFISIVAGLVRVPAGRFGILSLIGTVLYAAALSSIGYALGSAWQSVSHGLTVVGYILFALVVMAIVGFIVYRWRAFRREAQLKARPRPRRRGPGQPPVPGQAPPSARAPPAPAPRPWTPNPAAPGPRPVPGPVSGPGRTRTGPASQRPRSASSYAAR